MYRKAMVSRSHISGQNVKLAFKTKPILIIEEKSKEMNSIKLRRKQRKFSRNTILQ